MERDTRRRIADCLTDVTIVCRGHRYEANRSLLIGYSDYFRGVFAADGVWRERAGSTLEEKDVCWDKLRPFLDVVHGRAPIDDSNVLDVAEMAAHRYSSPHLVNDCQRLLIHTYRPEQFDALTDCAIRNSMWSLLGHALLMRGRSVEGVGAEQSRRDNALAAHLPPRQFATLAASYPFCGIAGRISMLESWLAADPHKRDASVMPLAANLLLRREIDVLRDARVSERFSAAQWRELLQAHEDAPNVLYHRSGATMFVHRLDALPAKIAAIASAPAIQVSTVAQDACDIVRARVPPNTGSRLRVQLVACPHGALDVEECTFGEVVELGDDWSFLAELRLGGCYVHFLRVHVLDDAAP